MNFATLQAAMKAAIVSASGIASTRVRWAHESAAATWIAYPCAVLQLKHPRAVGVDQIVYTYDGGEDTLYPTHEGPREMLLEVKIETDTQVPGSDVMQIASDLVTRIRRESVRSAMLTAGLALATIEPVVYAGYRSDDRMLSAAVVEMRLLAAETDRDSLSTGDYITDVSGVSETLYGPDGAALPEESFEVP